MPSTRRTLLVSAGTALAATAVSAPARAASHPEVEALALRAAQAHEALMRGDIVRYRSFITTTNDFTLMAPFGGKPTRGADFSEERWESIGRFFRNGRDSTLELIHAYSCADMVVLAAIERTHVEVGGLAGQDWALRVTLVFRKEQDQWRLAHRHADPIADGISLEQAASITRRRPA